MAAKGRGLISLHIYIENFKNLLVRNHWTDFIITWQKCFLSTKIVQVIMICQKNVAARGRGLFSLYIEKFKNLLVRNQWTDFNITWQECFFGDPLSRLFKPSWFVKNMAARGRGIFSLYICIENFKNLLVTNRWIEFNVTWHECCFGDLLPRLFTPSWYVKKHGRQGQGLFFVYVYRKL